MRASRYRLHYRSRRVTPTLRPRCRSQSSQLSIAVTNSFSHCSKPLSNHLQLLALSKFSKYFTTTSARYLLTAVKRLKSLTIPLFRTRYRVYQPKSGPPSSLITPTLSIFKLFSLKAGVEVYLTTTISQSYSCLSNCSPFIRPSEVDWCDSARFLHYSPNQGLAHFHLLNAPLCPGNDSQTSFSL
jgi:hypothetical protein